MCPFWAWIPWTCSSPFPRAVYRRGSLQPANPLLRGRLCSAQWEVLVGMEIQEEKRNQGVSLIPPSGSMSSSISISSAVPALPRKPLVPSIVSPSLSAQAEGLPSAPGLTLSLGDSEPLHPLGNRFPALCLLCYPS